ncbi:MAG: coenzyme F420-0:L-glutamate ligase [Gammaproteobacteria bacterium]|nr:coenzyme F420-0:L-glutamate ligase [Gammaproteobacteria bacterium]
MPGRAPSLSLIALTGLPEIRPGDDLAALLGDALAARAAPLARRDVLVVSQKIVSKAEDRYVDLEQVAVSPRARLLAEATGKDARVVEVVLGESRRVVRARPGLIICEHRLGMVMANAGVDRSNVGAARSESTVLLLPADPDASAAALAAGLARRFGAPLAVIVSDSAGRAWRNGVVGFALGASGLPALVDRRGAPDRQGRALEVTEVAFADQIASAAALLMGEADEGIPAVLVRGLDWSPPPLPAARLLRPAALDMFR